VPREQKSLACTAAEEVCLARFAEGDGGVGRPFTKYHHVGEVGLGRWFGVWLGQYRFVFAKDTAGGEDGEDRAHDVGCGGEGEVSGVVLWVFSHSIAATRAYRISGGGYVL
jgi:hypothetical protein